MWHIVRHSLGLLWRNRGTALRLSIGPLVLLAILTQGSGLLMTGGLFDGGTGLVLSLLSALLLSWVAVAWHRFVLLEEAPTGLLPALPGPETFQHLGWSLLLGLGAMLLNLALGPVLVRIFDAAPASAGGNLLAGYGPLLVPLLLVTWLGLRLGLVLPGAALGRGLTLQDSWAATRPLARTFAGLAVLEAVLVLGLPHLTFRALLALTSEPPVWTLLATMAALQWLTMMLTLATLTTLYGHLVERRPLA
jgi:hypothetical protein